MNVIIFNLCKPSKGEPGNAVTMQRGGGSIYKLTNESLLQKTTGMSISNGMTWSLDNRKMFVVDTMERTVNSFDFDIDSGTISE
jgi:sugar lactone lactonase YvrE